MQFVLCVFLVVLAVAAAFNGAGRSTSARISMLFGGGKKKTESAPKKAAARPGQANKGEYIPAGLTKAQYEKVKAQENAKAEKTKKSK